MKKILLALMAIIALSSCTDNSMASSFGGTERINLLQGEKLISMTWKGDNLWLLTVDGGGTYHFREKSSMGFMDGEVIVNEIGVSKSEKAVKLIVPDSIKAPK